MEKGYSDVDEIVDIMVDVKIALAKIGYDDDEKIAAILAVGIMLKQIIELKGE